MGLPFKGSACDSHHLFRLCLGYWNPDPILPSLQVPTWPVLVTGLFCWRDY